MTVLFVDDEEHLRHAAAQSFELAEIEAECLSEPDAALARIDRAFPGVLVSDIRMPGIDGLELMRRVLEIDPEFPVILVTGHGDVAMAVDAMRDGAYDFIEKPFAPDRLVGTVRRALDKRALTLENRSLRREVGGRDVVEARLTGRSQIMQRLRSDLRAIAATEADVLITGETGTGKEVAARALHRASGRDGKPFVHINCAALPREMVESELFGHEAGAFAGALRTRVGRFEFAKGGTVFLDEIDSLLPSLQGKLLHAVQNREVTRLGSNEPIPLDVRFVAASKSDLKAAADEGTFRADLLYRLAVVTLRMPSLADRREDVAGLFLTLLAEAAVRYRCEVPSVPGAVLDAIAARDWPGNVRELKNAAERYVLGLDSDFDRMESNSEQSLAERMAAHEKSLIAAAITAHGGSLKNTYEALGLSRKALYDKMQRHGLNRDDFRD